MLNSLSCSMVLFCILPLWSGSPLLTDRKPSASKPAASKPKAGVEAPLGNADVVRLSQLDLGDEVVIAKIRQAESVAFALDTESLGLLRKQGVSKAVIAAMLARASGPVSNPATTGVPEALTAPPATTAAFPKAMYTMEEGVVLRTGGKDVRLHSVQGDFSTRWAFVVTLTFLDFPGMKADARVTEARPSFFIRTNKNPRGRFFLVKCEAGDNTRSVKIGKASPFGASSWSSPDSDWTFEYDMKEVGQDLWEIQPKQDLKPGEYGLLFKGGFTGAMNPLQGELFDFGMD